MWNLGHKKDPNSTKNENFQNPNTYFSSYIPEAILWEIWGPYIDRDDQNSFLKLKMWNFGHKMDLNSTKN